MHRIARDQILINCAPTTLDLENDIIIIIYGEIDCRCHIGRQVALGRKLEEIVDTLVVGYMQTITQYEFKNVIILAVPPPIPIEDFERRHGGPIRHHLPFVGTDEERVHYTQSVNMKLQQECERHGFHFLDPYDTYKRENGVMEFSKSDGTNHVGNNAEILCLLKEVVKKLIVDSHETS
jgi:hypothetical protein